MDRPATLLFYYFAIGLLAILITACTTSLAAGQPTGETGAAPSNLTLSTAPAPTSIPTSTLIPSPTPSPTHSPSPTPAPSLRQLTEGGCCVQPDFSPDGQQVLFIDKPGQDKPVGIYGLELADPQPAPTLIYETIGFRSPDWRVVATMDGNLARFVDETTGQSWAVDTGGNWPRYSPDGSQLLWVASDREGPYDRRQNDIWLANLNGSNPQLLLSVYGGGLAGWFPDGQRLLLVGRDLPSQELVTLFVYNLETGQRTDLFNHKRLRGAEISPGGSWVIFFLSMTDDEPVENGLWVVKADGDTQHKLNLPGFGAYRWQDDGTLLYIPMRASSEESMQLWAVDVAANRSRPLTDPASLSFSISNGDWEVSPDGRQVLFVSSQDQNIWLITLPQP